MQSERSRLTTCFGGQGKQGAEEVERLTASLADEQAPLAAHDPKPKAPPRNNTYQHFAS